MTQKELIEFCKENDPNYNKDASFVILEPFWNKSAIGITESEWKRGIYICIDVKGKEGYKRYDKRVFYFKRDFPKESQIATFDTHYKKFFIHLMVLDEIGVEIIREPSKNIENFTEFMEGIKPVEEFPIVKESVDTWYSKRGIKLNVGMDQKGFSIGTEFELTEMILTKEQFSDLVDLMIEARKDLLK